MLKESLEIIKKIEDSGFETYIVGGFVRDYYMKKESIDVDICTSAKPKDLVDIFEGAILPSEKYGAVTLYHKNIRYEITTFRKELVYENRKPIEIEYSNSFIDDIKRRDFRMNTLCMNSKGDIIDILNGKEDIDKRVIRTIDDANKKFNEDPLRMLRAVRFATQLNFRLDHEVINAIKNNGYLLKNLSYDRKKDELNKIFINTNAKTGIKLIEYLNLSEYLELNNLNKLRVTTDVLGIWAQLDVIDKYPFTRLEKNTINTINEIRRSKRIDRYEIYKYGLYDVSIAAEIMDINKKFIAKINSKLCIHSKKDIDIDTEDICNILNKKAGEWLKYVYNDIEDRIICLELENDKEKIKAYILKNY